MAENRINRELDTREKTARKRLGSVRKFFRRRIQKLDTTITGCA
jgi:hypothetical protein